MHLERWRTLSGSSQRFRRRAASDLRGLPQVARRPHRQAGLHHHDVRPVRLERALERAAHVLDVMQPDDAADLVAGVGSDRVVVSIARKDFR